MFWTSAIVCLELASKLILDCSQNCDSGQALGQRWFLSEEEIFFKSLSDGTYFSDRMGSGEVTSTNQSFSDFYSNLWRVYAKDHLNSTTLPKIHFNHSVHDFDQLERDNGSLVLYLEVQNMTHAGLHEQPTALEDPKSEDSYGEYTTLSPRRRFRPKRRRRILNSRRKSPLVFNGRSRLAKKSFRFRSRLSPKSQAGLRVSERRMQSKKQGPRGSKAERRHREQGSFVRFKSNLTPKAGQRRSYFGSHEDVEHEAESETLKGENGKDDKGLKGLFLSFVPAFLTLSSLLGFGVGTLFGKNDENSITFNPTITYAGDNITFTVTDTDTITNGNDQNQNAQATNDITNTDTNSIQTSIIPIVINTDGTVTVMGPISAGGRSFMNDPSGDAKYRIINRREFAYGSLPTGILNQITDFFSIPVEFFNDHESIS
eukprot:maker-scaffold857_size87770-snap-gene-0.26 protein:Tk01673 transcript:maker-scaffold857_size87770-snap-gene-0.26-mRNA-1 annotation:"rtx toxin"